MAERVSDRMGLLHISTGDMLRAEIKKGSELGKKAQSYIDQGALVPDEVIIGMIEQRLKEPDAQGGVLFDGFPRTVPQAEALDKIADIASVINLEVPVQVIVDRVITRRVCPNCGAVYNTKTYDKDTCEKCGATLITRPDDNEETVLERFRVYEEQTAPLIVYYGKKGIVHDIDATMPIEQEADMICQVLGEK
ncbi:MAG: nucleoside monophosphate kinase [Clostridia bacterium]|nr:nucleoside monophosphate kinase [Clostridia bacterium]